MKKKKETKISRLLWWKRIGNSINQNIDCPCVVTQVVKGQFTVTSLDDFVESDLISKDSTAFREELRPTTKKKVISFLEKKSKAIEARVQKAQEELRDAQACQAMFERDISRIKWAIK